MAQPRLVLLDGHALAYRAYFALPPNLSTRDGELTSGTFGFASMLLKVLQELKPDYIAVTFDVGRTFRHDLSAEYKATRAKMPDELAVQMNRIRELVAAFNIPVFELDGYEADDVLGTLSRQAAEQGIETIIVTGDTDAFQLIDDRVKVYTSGRQFSETKLYDEAAIVERYGLKPRQLVDFKSLTGDKSDNIPGVAGIGEKTAAQLLQKYGTLEGIYEHLDEIENKRVRTALEQGREAAFQSRKLVQIVRDAPIQLDLKACRVSNYNRDKVVALFRDLEFRTLLGRLPGEQRPEPAPAAALQMPLFGAPEAATGGAPSTAGASPTGDYRAVDTPEALRDLAQHLRQATGLAVDVETDSTVAMTAGLVGIALSDRQGVGYYVPVGHKGATARNVRLAEVRKTLGPILADPAIPKYAHNGKFDLMVLRNHGMDLSPIVFDTMIAEWLVDPASRNLGLKNLAWARLHADMTPITDLIGTGKGQISMAAVGVEQVAPYAAADADMTLRLVAALEPELRSRELWHLFEEVEMPLVPVLARMEENGVALDLALLAEMSWDLAQRLGELEKEIYGWVGYEFNINSTQQLSDALFGKLGLPTNGLRKTSSGSYSTAVDTLETLKDKHPVVNLILEHRQLSKIKSTYVDALPKLVNPKTGRVHTSYNQTGTVTGRLSSSDPNLQNIPVRTEVGRRVRNAFIAESGWTLIKADYSQVELRILAHVSQDPAMLEAFARGEDIHATTASAVYGVPLSEVTPELRRVAKTANFAVTYGVTGYGLAQSTGLSQEEAEQFIRNYFARFPKVKEYLERTKKVAAERGWVETLLGRRRYFPELKSTAPMHAQARAAAERMAINMPIQGTAADIIKIAMVRLQKALDERGLRSKLILQVHDELVLEAPEAEVEETSALVKNIMEGALKLDAPLKVDIKHGCNWGEME
ncbi:MAG: DNA polymerase I [Chloroflexi bacterium]|nr:DNA polymerase I [Chloroflexota bacterium]